MRFFKICLQLAVISQFREILFIFVKMADKTINRSNEKSVGRMKPKLMTDNESSVQSASEIRSK